MNKTYEKWLCKPMGIKVTDSGATAGRNTTGPVTFEKVNKINEVKITPDEARQLNKSYDNCVNTDGIELFLLPGAPEQFTINQINY